MILKIIFFHKLSDLRVIFDAKHFLEMSVDGGERPYKIVSFLELFCDCFFERLN